MREFVNKLMGSVYGQPEKKDIEQLCWTSSQCLILCTTSQHFKLKLPAARSSINLLGGTLDDIDVAIFSATSGLQ